MSDIQGYGYSFVDLVDHKNKAEVKSALANGGGSQLMALAIMLGNIADKMLARVMDLAADLDNLQDQKAEIKNGGEDPGGMGENQLTAQLQAQTQLMSMFMQAMTTVIKSLGEANRDVARKQ